MQFVVRHKTWRERRKNNILDEVEQTSSTESGIHILYSLMYIVFFYYCCCYYRFCCVLQLLSLDFGRAGFKNAFHSEYRGDI